MKYFLMLLTFGLGIFLSNYLGWNSSEVIVDNKKLTRAEISFPSQSFQIDTLVNNRLVNTNLVFPELEGLVETNVINICETNPNFQFAIRKQVTKKIPICFEEAGVTVCEYINITAPGRSCELIITYCNGNKFATRIEYEDSPFCFK